MDGPDVRAWEIGTWRPLGVIAHHASQLDALAFLPDGRLEKTLRDFPTQAYTALAFAPDGRYLAMARHSSKEGPWRLLLIDLTRGDWPLAV